MAGSFGGNPPRVRVPLRQGVNNLMNKIEKEPKNKYARWEIFHKGQVDTQERATACLNDIMAQFMKFFDQMQEFKEKGGEK